MHIRRQPCTTSDVLHVDKAVTVNMYRLIAHITMVDKMTLANRRDDVDERSGLKRCAHLPSLTSTLRSVLGRDLDLGATALTTTEFLWLLETGLGTAMYTYKFRYKARVTKALPHQCASLTNNVATYRYPSRKNSSSIAGDASRLLESRRLAPYLCLLTERLYPQ